MDHYTFCVAAVGSYWCTIYDVCMMSITAAVGISAAIIIIVSLCTSSALRIRTYTICASPSHHLQTATGAEAEKCSCINSRMAAVAEYEIFCYVPSDQKGAQQRLDEGEHDFAWGENEAEWIRENPKQPGDPDAGWGQNYISDLIANPLSVHW